MEVVEKEETLYFTYSELAIYTLIAMGIVFIFTPSLTFLSSGIITWAMKVIENLFGGGIIPPSDPLGFSFFILTLFIMFISWIMPFFITLFFAIIMLYISYSIVKRSKIRIPRTRGQNSARSAVLIVGIAVGVIIGIFVSLLLFPVDRIFGVLPALPPEQAFAQFFYIIAVITLYFISWAGMGLLVGYGSAFLVDFIAFIYRRAYGIKLEARIVEYEYYTLEEKEALSRLSVSFAQTLGKRYVYIIWGIIIGIEILVIAIIYPFFFLPYLQWITTL